MSDEDPHNSNGRREKKSKLFRPHEITDGEYKIFNDQNMQVLGVGGISYHFCHQHELLLVIMISTIEFGHQYIHIVTTA